MSPRNVMRSPTVRVLALLLVALCAAANDNWQFLHAYPRHYVSTKLQPSEAPPVIDGKLDEAVWANAPWTEGGFVDITNHSNDTLLNQIPDYLQARVKMRWDADYLYIGAQVLEPFIYADYSHGHNTVAPYHDNDFEVFIDVSGTTQYYKEFEMNAINATYDVSADTLVILWGVPDMAQLDCDSNASRPWLPVCVNTSFPGYAGSWSMVPSLHGEGSGMRVATSYDESAFGRFVFPNNSWSLEIAFPIHGGDQHGGLLDANTNVPQLQQEYRQYDPNRRNHSDNKHNPTYWWIDFARAEHPRQYLPNGNVNPHEAHPAEATPATICPLNCTSDLAGYSPVLTNPDAVTCQQCQDAWPTLLGANPSWGCYWEFVWQNLGSDAYMHRPTAWAMLQFANEPETAMCRNAEFPARHVVKQIHLAQRAYFTATGEFSDSAAALAVPQYCTMPACALADLRTALGLTEIFAVSIIVSDNATQLTRECTARPCYTANVTMVMPRDPTNAVRAPHASTSGVTATINENRWLRVLRFGAPPCL